MYTRWWSGGSVNVARTRRTLGCRQRERSLISRERAAMSERAEETLIAHGMESVPGPWS